MNPDIQKMLNELHQLFESIYGNRMERMILFGSYARGEATLESDIDVMLILRGPVRPGEEINRISENRAEISLRNTLLYLVSLCPRSDLQLNKSPLLINVHNGSNIFRTKIESQATITSIYRSFGA